MYADPSIVQIAAHAFIAYLFVWTGIYNASSRARTRDRIAHLASRGVPFPAFVLYSAYAWQIVGGLMVLADFHTEIAALMLIVFTVLAEFLFHNYWAMKDPLRRMYHRLIFLNNCGVLGGLLLLLVR
jgi:putative oxidoreductase